MSHRNMKYLYDHRIIYRRNPINDIPTEVYDWGMFFENGTHEYYNLFQTPAKITTYKSLKWHLLVLWYLNPTMPLNKFKKLTDYICERKNNFITFSASQSLKANVVKEVFESDLEQPPKNKIKKVIFKDMTGLSINEKLSIVGSLIGKSKKITAEDIYEYMVTAADHNQKITIPKIANHFGVTTRTVHRNMDEQLKNEKDLLNNEVLQRTKLHPV